MHVVSQPDTGAQKGHPDKGEAGQLLGPVEGRVQGIAKQHLEEDEDRHGRCQKRSEVFYTLIETFTDSIDSIHQNSRLIWQILK